MGVLWDTGYRPAYDHEGAPVTVLTDGRVLEGHHDDTGAAVTGSVFGWRAGCECGWRGNQLFPRAEYELQPAEGNVPIDDGISPEEVDKLCSVQWEAHLHQVLPLLAVHDAARTLAQVTLAYDDARAALADAVRAARTRHPAVSWQSVADVVGITRQSAHERWA